MRPPTGPTRAWTSRAGTRAVRAATRSLPSPGTAVTCIRRRRTGARFASSPTVPPTWSAAARRSRATMTSADVDAARRPERCHRAGSCSLPGGGVRAGARSPVCRSAPPSSSRGRWAVPHALDAIGGAPRLVRQGASVAPRCRSAFCLRHPRTGVGVTAEGTVLLVVVDGRSRRSVGMTLRRFGRTMRELGAVEAMNLDGGGSSAMWIRGRGIVNRPSDASGERPVVNAMLVLPGADQGEAALLRPGVVRQLSGVTGSGPGGLAATDPGSSGGLADAVLDGELGAGSIDRALRRLAASFGPRASERRSDRPRGRSRRPASRSDAPPAPKHRARRGRPGAASCIRDSRSPRPGRRSSGSPRPSPLQLRREAGFGDVVQPGRAAATIAAGDVDDVQSRHRTQQRSGLEFDPLGAQRVARVVVGDRGVAVAGEPDAGAEPLVEQEGHDVAHRQRRPSTRSP